MVVKTLLLPDGQVAAELTAVDTDRGINASIGLDPPILSHLIWQHRGLRAAWRRAQYREGLEERRKVKDGA